MSIIAVESRSHLNCTKLLRKLRVAPDHTLLHSVLLKRMKVDTQTFQKIIQTLTQQGDIAMNQERTTGRPGIHYKLMRE